MLLSNADAGRQGRQNAAGLGFVEFVVLMAAIMALNALAIDIMLPALQDIGAELGEDDPNRRQTVITAYLLGFGVTQIFCGPLIDRFGRRVLLIFGLLTYAAAGFYAVIAPTFESMLIARFVMGVGCAGPRVVAQALIRDCYSGRTMARVMSLTMMVFMAVPVIAPSLGQAIFLMASWRWIFIVLGLAGIGAALWSALRIRETLMPEDRIPLQVARVAAAYVEVVRNRLTVGYTLAATLVIGSLLGMVNSAQQVFVDVYGLGELFPLAFALNAVLMAASFMLNASLVRRIGMRRLSHGALIAFVVFSGASVLLGAAGVLSLAPFMILQALSMSQIGLLMANFNALAIEPHGKVAGTASAVIGFVTTTGGALYGFTIGHYFDGTAMPLVVGFLAAGVTALAIVLLTEKGKLFQPAPGRD